MSNTYHISESEWRVLRCLWKRSPLEIKDLVSMLGEETGWNANMIRTLVLRSQGKGVWEITKDAWLTGAVLLLDLSTVSNHDRYSLV